MTSNHLHDPFQAPYNNSTALRLKVHNEIMWTIKKKGVTILVLLDLSAAFDTIDYNVLFHHMQDLLDVHGTPLQWFRSYLSGRLQCVHIKGEFLSPQEFKFGVPQ